MKIITDVFESMPYALRFPDCYEEGQRYPILLFLHGAGTRGEDINNVLNHSFLRRFDGMPELPFIVAFPLCNQNTWFDMFEILQRFTLFIREQPYADTARYYLTGNSMGGYGSWQLGMTMPQVFAAIAPVCGGGMYWNGGRLVGVPVWAFHGALDTTVYPEESIKMVAGINKKGGNAKITIYPDAKHDSWTATYENPEFYSWLLSHKKSETVLAEDEFKDTKAHG